MNNKSFKVGDNIIVSGFRGVVESISNCNEYRVSYNGKVLGNGLEVFDATTAEACRAKGYTLEPTGRTATYFTVCFDDNDELKNSSYNHGTFGCLDDFENYGTF